VRRRVRALLGAGLVALVAAAGLLLGAAPAGAHARLSASDPPDGARLTHLPATVRLTFEEAIVLDGSSITLEQGSTSLPLVDLALEHGGTVLRGSVPDGAPDRPATFRWAVVSDDGHLVTGDLRVGVGASAPPAADRATPRAAGDPDLVRHLVTVDRLVGYLALSVLCGGLVFLSAVWPGGADVARSRSLLWASWAAGLATAVAGVGLQAATLRGGQLSAALRGSALAPVLTSPFGHAWGARVALFLLALPVLVALDRGGAAVVRRPWFVGSAAAVAVGLLRTPGFVAHASEGHLGVLGSMADLAHLLGVAVWMGGLVFLVAVVLPRRRTAELRTVVPAFSRLAAVAIVAIVAGGSVMAWQLAGSWRALDSTEWGRLLLLKVGLFTAILVIARLSKRWVDERLGLTLALRGHLLLVRPFVLSVAAEAVLAASVLGVASLLVTTSPGR
jgi:putative copper export protein/methionine-rich copper-binding protein CopC